MTPVEFRPAAAADVERAALWYDGQRPGLGSEFLSAVQDAVAKVAENPELYPVVYRGARRILLAHFPYSLYYKIEANRALLAACIHGRRREKRWRSRL